MKMLKFSEIKRDYKNNYGYVEYEQRYKGYDVHIILDMNRCNYLCLYFTDYKYECTMIIEINEFMKMSYKDYIKRVNEWLFYNLQEIDA